MAKIVSIVTCALLLVYFLFTSGLIFEESHSEVVGKIELPYSLALSGERLSIVGIFNDDDVACAEWLAGNFNGTLIKADYNGYRLLMGCMHELENFVFPTVTDEYYLFLSTWNVEHRLMVIGTCPGLRQYSPLPDLSGVVEVFRRGDTVVYYFEGETE